MSLATETTARTPRIQAILDATLRVIGERGLEAVTHRSVAESAGVSVGAISHHFSSREQLLEEALMYAARREIERLDRLALELSTAVFDTNAWIEVMAASLARDLKRDPVAQLASYEFLLASARNPRLREHMREWNAAHRRLAEVGLRGAGSDSPELHAEIVVATMTGAMLKQLAYRENRFERDVLAPMLSELVGGLTGGRGADA